MVISRQASNPELAGLPAVYLAHFADAVFGDADRAAELLHTAGLSMSDFEPDQRIPLDLVMALLERIDTQARPGWHVDAALALEAAHHGPVGVAVSTAPSIGQALELLARFECLRFPFAALQCELGTERWCARVLPLVEPDGPWELLLEIHLISLTGLLERLLARHRRKLQIGMPQGYRAWRSALEARFGPRLSFSGRHFRLELPADVLADACLLADRRLHQDAVARCEQLLALQTEASPLSAALRARLLASTGGFPTLEETARGLCCSSRTLIRRLNAAGTGYRRLVDESWRILALDLLRRSDLSLADISERLGYRDVANFGRACRRWYGQPPGRLRRRGE